MIETVFSIGLPVGETYKINRKRFMPQNGSTRRISIVSGIHGDELEGQYVCFLLGKFLNENIEHLQGIVDIYPAVNSIGIDSIMRKVPPLEVDLNRVFPGNPNDVLPHRIADGLVNAIKGSEIAIDIHSSNIFLRELPQVRIAEENAAELVPLAVALNIDFVWVHGAVTVLQSTFAHTMNSLGTKTLVAEMGVGMRITKEYCESFTNGLIKFLENLGFLTTNITPVIKKPIVSTNGTVHFLNASRAGIFVPETDHNKFVKKGEKIGQIVSALKGEVCEDIFSPCSGLLFTLREYPVVYEGSLLARIYEEKQ